MIAPLESSHLAVQKVAWLRLYANANALAPDHPLNLTANALEAADALRVASPVRGEGRYLVERWIGAYTDAVRAWDQYTVVAG